jgi:hypothetical protein
MNTRTWLGVAALLGLAIALGSLREFVFINLNYQVSAAGGQTPWSYAHSAVQRALEGWSVPALLRLKWLLAVAFILAMGTLTFATGRLLFGSRLDRVILLGYGLIALLALLLHVAAHWLPFTASAGVKLLHLLQYPMPIAMLVVARFLPGEGGRDRA